MTTIEKSLCRTCSKQNGHADIMGPAEATQHQDHYPDHHVLALEDLEVRTESKGVLKLAPALIIPKPMGSMGGYLAYVTADVYESYLEARLQFPNEDAIVIWPASHDADGFYSVTE